MARGSDATLVTRVISGDAEAFEALVSRHQRTAHAIARALGVPASNLDDVVQEAFLKAFRDLGDLKDRTRFLPWFLVIVRNCALQSHRGINQPPAQNTRHDQQDVPPVDQLEGQELREHLRRKVAELPDGIREAIFIYYYEGRSIAQVARALGTTRSAAKKRLQKGREILRTELWRELSETLRDMIPSTRKWKRRARNLALLAAAVTPSWGMTAMETAPAMSSDVGESAGTPGFRLSEGGTRMKLTVIGSSLILLVAAVAVYVAVSDSSEDLSAQGQSVVSDPEAYREMERRLMSMPVNLVFEGEPLDNALRTLVDLTRFSIQVKDVEPRDPSRMLLNINIADTPFLDALKLIAAQHDLAVRITPDGVVLTGKPENYPILTAESI